MRIARTWAIPNDYFREARIPKEGQFNFLKTLGVDPDGSWESWQDDRYASTIIQQPTPINYDPAVPLPVERMILEELVPDEDLWEYTEFIERAGNTLRILPSVRAYNLVEINKGPEIKSLTVNEVRLTYNFERACLLVAIDEDSLKVYWNRGKTL